MLEFDYREFERCSTSKSANNLQRRSCDFSRDLNNEQLFLSLMVHLDGDRDCRRLRGDRLAGTDDRISQ